MGLDPSTDWHRDGDHHIHRQVQDTDQAELPQTTQHQGTVGHICLGDCSTYMRTSTTFGQITANLLADPIQLADILSQPLTKKLKGKKGGGKGKHKGKKGNTWQNYNWYNRQHYNPWRPSPYSQQDNMFYGPAPRPQIQQYQAFPPAPPPPANTTTPYNSYNNEKGKGKQKGKYNNPHKGYKGQGKYK